LGSTIGRKVADVVTIGQEIVDMLPTHAAVALRESNELNGIALKYAGWVDQGYSPATLISTIASQVGMDDRKLLLKYSPSGRSAVAEPRRHREAQAASSADFRRDHLVELPWAAIPVPGDGWIMFEQVAGGRLDDDDIRPLSALLVDPARADTLATACATVVHSMLTDWNPTVAAMDPYPTAGAYLRDLLGARLERGHPVRTWAEANGVLSGGRPVGGPPNPFALVLDNSLTNGRTMYVRLGNVHGDLHPGNILIPRDPAGYRLVDLSRFGRGRPLAFDPAYLLLTITARCLPGRSEPERSAIAEFLVDPTVHLRSGVPSAVRDVLGAIVAAAGAWGGRNGLGDEWRRELLLSVLGCALIMTGRGIIPDADRTWYYHLAELATARYLDLPSPTEPATATVHQEPPRHEVPVDIAPTGAAPVDTAVLPAGTTLWQVHRRSTPAATFVVDPTGRRSVLYAARRQITALLDGLLCDVPFGDDGERAVVPERLRGMRLSPLRTTRDLVLAGADGEPDLVGLWPPDGVHGVEWPLTSDLPEPTLLLLGDRCPAGTVRSDADDDAIDLDDPNRSGWLRDSLRPYRVRVTAEPAPRDSRSSS
jgi:hypothetical protein